MWGETLLDDPRRRCRQLIQKHVRDEEWWISFAVDVTGLTIKRATLNLDRNEKTVTNNTDHTISLKLTSN